jgi:hypothetical protein
MAGMPACPQPGQVKIWARLPGRARGRGSGGTCCGLGGLERHRVGDLLGGVAVGAGPMFHPASECSRSPFHAFSLIWNRYHSAMPCFTLWTRNVVEFMPPMSIGPSVANSGIPASASCFSSFSVERIPAGPLDVLAHDSGEPGRWTGCLGQQVGHAAVAGNADVDLLVRGAVAALVQVHPGRTQCPSSARRRISRAAAWPAAIPVTGHGRGQDLCYRLSVSTVFGPPGRAGAPRSRARHSSVTRSASGTVTMRTRFGMRHCPAY